MSASVEHGKICYVEFPAIDIARSAEFYRRVFGWEIRQRGDGSTAFDDTTGQVSGAWVVGRPPSDPPGLLLYIMVESVTGTLQEIVANDGAIAQPAATHGPMIIARFRDPAGNVIGLYQETT